MSSDKEQELRIAAEAGNIEFVKQLLEEGVDVNAADREGVTALDCAMNWLPHNPDKDILGLTKLLVEHGADVSKEAPNGGTALMYAAEEGWYEVVKFLIEQGANPDATYDDGWNALHIIGDKQGGRPLNFKVTIDKDGENYVLTDPDEIREAIGSHPDDEYLGYVATARLLIDKGINLNALKEEQQQTPLFDAAANGAGEIVAMILESEDINLDHQDKWGCTALHYTARNEHLGVIELLVDMGADINIQESYGFTPMHEAILNGNKEIVEFFIENSADVEAALIKPYNAYDKGDRALEIAQKSGKKDIADILQALE